ncbi:MAG: hypothetical protein HZB59_07825 [Ignavibacteriales bacterium]|nr:hypothetical protein [Ignavibacteriales bacterium]
MSKKLENGIHGVFIAEQTLLLTLRKEQRGNTLITMQAIFQKRIFVYAVIHVTPVKERYIYKSG